MSITRTLMGGILMFGAMQAHASSDGTDSHCVVGKNRTLFNQCDYPVDVGFCVENPQQTKNFFDSSEAFKCPNGGLSTLQPGKEEGNILNGTVHWFACSTAHRGSAGWKYVPGSGYKGHCAREESSVGSGSPAAERGLERPGEPAIWGATTECNDWFPEGAYGWRELDPATNKLMCKRPLSSSARTATAQRYIESKRMEADAVQRKREEVARAEQRQRDDAARADQQFRTGLQTMNAGQLFARADELSSQGDRARAREVQRALISRFPDHPLAATAARQMAGESGGNANPSAGESSMPAGGAVSGGRLSGQACEAMKQSVIATKVPSNASITARSETVMFMTKTALNMIAGGCASGVAPAQIDAERQQHQQQYTDAESACNTVQSGGRRCGPRNHFGPGAL
ncbi:hypothetical protein J2W34_001836 [Variovorax boronicumulans]|uniref:hypothetical protein n=1 Tax=Variovorax boronicumulans TaxID=436515 RepID=UPI00277D82AC|nr:hypothetical protein [Variovorax boronicumulans]MDQ0070062.1 hypothetical protein [Variovorax boronicumulans]